MSQTVSKKFRNLHCIPVTPVWDHIGWIFLFVALNATKSCSYYKTFVNFAVSAFTSISQQPIYHCHIYRSLQTPISLLCLKWPAINRFRTLLHSLLTTPILRCLQWHKITEHIECTHLVTKSSLPHSLCMCIKLICLQPPRSTRCSPLVTLSRPPTSSLLRTTDRSFRCAPSLSLEPALCFSPSTSSLTLCLWLTSSYSCQIIILGWFVTFIIHNSLTLPFPAAYLLHKSVPPKTLFLP